jgi:hypothetical protein
MQGEKRDYNEEAFGSGKTSDTLADQAEDKLEGPFDNGNRLQTRVADQASQFSDAITESAMTAREQAAAGVESAAVRVRDAGEALGSLPQQATERAAEQMDRAAGYVKDHDTSSIAKDAGSYVRRHPVIAGAVALFAVVLLIKVLR